MPAQSNTSREIKVIENTLRAAGRDPNIDSMVFIA
jgi:hypothetical protein